MKRMIATLVTVVTVAGLAAAPAPAEPTRKTELVELGKTVDKLQLYYDVDAVWLVDNQNILYRDTYRDHYLVTLKAACKQLEVRGRGFNFFPSWSWQLLATRTYEVRPEAGERCGVAKVEQVDDAKADRLRDAAQRRVW